MATINTQYGACGFWVLDTENNIFRFPNIVGITENTTTEADLGKLTEAGLPNITGLFAVDGNKNNGNALLWGESGAFYAGSTSNTTAQYTPSQTSTTNGSNVHLDASRSSAIYSNSNTVQPQTISGYLYCVVATDQTPTEAETDINEIVTDLALKADVDLTNATPTSAFGTALNTAGIRTVVETYVNGTSWYRVYSDKWCEQGGQVNVTTTPAEVQLLKQMADTNYSVFVSSVETNAGYGASAGNLTVSSFKICANSNDSRKLTAWLVVGYTN